MFYKIINDELVSGPFVQFPDGMTLNIQHLDEVPLPYEGWYYFETEQEAKDFFGITDD